MKKINRFHFLIAIILLVIYFSYRRSVIDEKISNNHLIICADIINMRAGKGVNVIYRLSYKDSVYEFNKRCPNTIYQSYKNGDYKMLVVMQKDNPKLNAILAEDEDFAKYKITEKDTLNVLCK